MNRTGKIRLIVALGLMALPSFAGAQSLAKFAPPGALFAIELNDLQGAKKTANSFVSQYEALDLVGTLLEAQNVPAKELAHPIFDPSILPCYTDDYARLFL